MKRKKAVPKKKPRKAAPRKAAVPTYNLTFGELCSAAAILGIVPPVFTTKVHDEVNALLVKTMQRRFVIRGEDGKYRLVV
jgi:hypothetical protein